MVTVLLFAGLVAVLATQRALELKKSAVNEAKMRAAGATEHAPHQLTWMRLIHGGWLFCSLAEVLIFDRPFVPWLAVLACGVLAIGQWLRYSAMRALEWRWTVRVMTLPDREPVTTGIFRHMRHPNYLGVILEIAALPLIHGAWVTAIVFSTLNGLLLWQRIRVEEAALENAGVYYSRIGNRPRLWPRSVRG